jgi:hypothetical protein
MYNLFIFTLQKIFLTCQICGGCHFDTFTIAPAAKVQTAAQDFKSRAAAYFIERCHYEFSCFDME